MRSCWVAGNERNARSNVLRVRVTNCCSIRHWQYSIQIRGIYKILIWNPIHPDLSRHRISFQKLYTWFRIKRTWLYHPRPVNKCSNLDTKIIENNKYLVHKYECPFKTIIRRFICSIVDRFADKLFSSISQIIIPQFIAARQFFQCTFINNVDWSWRWFCLSFMIDIS